MNYIDNQVWNKMFWDLEKRLKHLISIAHERAFCAIIYFYESLYLLNSPDGNGNTFWLHNIVFVNTFPKRLQWTAGPTPAMGTETALLNNQKVRLLGRDPSLCSGWQRLNKKVKATHRG